MPHGLDDVVGGKRKRKGLRKLQDFMKWFSASCECCGQGVDPSRSGQARRGTRLYGKGLPQSPLRGLRFHSGSGSHSSWCLSSGLSPTRAAPVTLSPSLAGMWVTFSSGFPHLALALALAQALRRRKGQVI